MASELQVTSYCRVAIDPHDIHGKYVSIQIRLETSLHGILYAQEVNTHDFFVYAIHGPSERHQLCVGGQWYTTIEHPTHHQPTFLNPSVKRAFHEAYRALEAWFFSVPNVSLIDIENNIWQSHNTTLST